MLDKNLLEKKSGNKQTPLEASISKRYRLNKNGSQKATYHIEIAIPNTGYQEGDSLAIFPLNPPALVARILNRLGLEGHESCQHEKLPSVSNVLALLLKSNLSNLRKTHLEFFLSHSPSIAKHFELETCLQNPATVKELLSTHHLQDFLLPCQDLKKHWKPLLSSLSPLLPRFYSIASSPLIHPDSIHLTVAKLEYPLHNSKRLGCCSHYLCKEVPLNQKQLSVYLQPSSHFKLPNPQTPIIMVGPGTGIAPFRAFMQRRYAQDAKENWLFFGEQHQAFDFYYQEEWEYYQKKGYLQVHTAFSRDQEYKIYVQDRLWENREQLFDWLENKKAIFYLCGDAKRMAKDVENTLKALYTEKMGEEMALKAIKSLRKEKRLLKDVY